jgi:glycosyltransferase involved in cell wall biosynthesis
MNRILYVQYTNPGGYPPLQHSSRMLADAGWNVLFLGTGAAGANSLEFPPHPNVLVRRMAFHEAGWRQKLHFLAFCLWVLWTTLIWHPRWVYVSDPFSCPAAVILSFIPGLRLLYHEHDSPQPSPPGKSLSAPIARSRRLTAQRADICVLPNAIRLERFQAELGPLRNSTCVWNCPASGEALKEPRTAATSPLWVLYHGSIVPDRLPAAVIDALALLPDFVRLRVVGYETIGSNGYIAALKRRAQSLGIDDRLAFLPAVPRADLLAIARTSHIGLALIPEQSSDGNFTAMTGASNKVFDYMACGQPVVVSDLPDWREMFVEPGYALECNPANPESIAAVIRRLIENPGLMRAMGESGRLKILADWNYEKVFGPVLDHLLGRSQTRTNPAIESSEPGARKGVAA